MYSCDDTYADDIYRSPISKMKYIPQVYVLPAMQLPSAPSTLCTLDVYNINSPNICTTQSYGVSSLSHSCQSKCSLSTIKRNRRHAKRCSMDDPLSIVFLLVCLCEIMRSVYRLSLVNDPFVRLEFVSLLNVKVFSSFQNRHFVSDSDRAFL